MKKIIYILLPLFLLISLNSCEDMFGDYLDQAPSLEMEESEVFNVTNNLKLFHNNIYTYLVSGYDRYGDGSFLDGASDLGEMSYQYGVTENGLNIGNYYGDYVAMETENPYYHYYEGIRVINYFLERIDTVTLNPTSVQNKPDEWKNNRKGECYFLRASFYWELLIRYGGVPIVKNALDLKNLNNIQKTKRNTVDDCFSFILADLNSAIAANLPNPQTKPNKGRPSKGAAMALKAKVLLFMASPLYNPNNDKAKWEQAMNASKAVIDLGTYSMMENYEDVFLIDYTSTAPTNSEIIFWRNESNRNWWPDQAPVGYGGLGGICPSQNLVDMYDMADGSEAITGYNADGSPIINPASGYSDNAPYENRDPRFYQTILYNGSHWWDRNIETFKGGLDKPAENTKATETGYYIRKFMDEETTPYARDVTSSRNWIYLRIPEMYLNYAEARNEFLDAPDEDVFMYVDTVRRRLGNGVSGFLPRNLTKVEVRERIRKERAVEFCFEEHRWWDLRRWKIAEEYLAAPIYGMEINRSFDGDSAVYSYNRVKVEDRVFEDKMYLYPMPENELFINPDMANNPGWD